MNVRPSRAFIKALQKLPPDRQVMARNALVLMAREPRPNSLDFRRLSGWDDYFIIDSTGGDRVILRKDEDGGFTAVDAGTHDIYRRWKRKR